MKWATATSGSLKTQDMFELGVCCEAAKDCMRISAEDLLRDVQGIAVLNSKSSDGTPMSVHQKKSYTLHSGRKFTASGKRGADFLVKNQFLRVRLGSEWQTRVILQEAVPLAHGKTVPAIQACQLRDWRSLRQMGHAGPSVEHYVFDRASYSAMERFLRQWHAHWPTKNQLPKSVAFSHEVIADIEFVVFTPLRAP